MSSNISADFMKINMANSSCLQYFSNSTNERPLSLVRNHSLVFTIRLFALLVAILNLTVLYSFRLNIKHHLYKYLIVIALVDLAYFFSMSSLSAFPRLCLNHRYNETLCSAPVQKTFFILLIFISDYLTSSLALFNILAEIYLTVQRILLITNSSIKHLKFKFSCFILFIISFTAYLPVLFMYKIEKDCQFNKTKRAYLLSYKITKTGFGKTGVSVVIQAALSATRILLVTLVLFVLNIIVICVFKRFLQKKIELKNINCGNRSRAGETSSNDSSMSFIERKNLRDNLDKAFRERYVRETLASKHFTLLVVSLSFLYIIGNLPILFYSIAVHVLNMPSDRLKNLYFISHLSPNLVVILKFFVYCLFYRPFRKPLTAHIKHIYINGDE